MTDQKVMGEDMVKRYNPKDHVLNDIFQAQESFGSKFCPFGAIRNSAELSPQVKKWLDIFSDCTLDECSEILGWLPWKHWKKYDDFQVNVLEMKFEMIDVLHFLVSQALLLQPRSKSLMWLNLERPEELDEYLVQAFAQVVKDTKTKLNTQEQKVAATKKILRQLQMSASYIYVVNELSEMHRMVKTQFTLLFSMFAVWDMDAQEIFDMYMSKNQENFDRQARGY